MEDFRGAYLERLEDKKQLEQMDRRLAAMHFGGVAIECLLKAMLVEIEHITEWHVGDENCPHCSALIRAGRPARHTLMNPGHNLQGGITGWNRLNYRFARDPRRREIIAWIEKIMKPSCHFIDLRYECASPNDIAFQEWQQAFVRLHGWLRLQNTELRRRR